MSDHFGCPFSKLNPLEFIGGFDGLAVACGCMEMPTSESFLVARGGPRTRTALLLEPIALRDQIALLERSLP
jgi:hypothetical protein